MLLFRTLQHGLHAVVEAFGKENLVVTPAVHDEGRDMPRHGRPVDVGLHRFFPTDGVARKQQKTAETFDLVKLLLAVVAAYLNPIFLHQHWHQIATIAFAVALNAADLVKKA